MLTIHRQVAKTALQVFTVVALGVSSQADDLAEARESVRVILSNFSAVQSAAPAGGPQSISYQDLQAIVNSHSDETLKTACRYLLNNRWVWQKVSGSSVPTLALDNTDLQNFADAMSAPRVARWFSSDPIVVASRQQGGGGYYYPGGSPVYPPPAYSPPVYPPVGYPPAPAGYPVTGYQPIGIPISGPGGGYPAPAPAYPYPAGAPPVRYDILAAGQCLRQGSRLNSNSGAYSFQCQPDGNLVLYHNGRGAIWATQTNGGNCEAQLANDGVLRLVDGAGTPIWASGSPQGGGNCYLFVQDDGNVVIYQDGGRVIWSTQTVGR
jgi:hypothetical protein